jgi:hypothetical protein
MLTGTAPMIAFGRRKVMYWSSADQILDFTTKDDVARVVALVALDADAPGSWRSPVTESPFAAGRMVAHGTTSVRSYAQVDVDAGLERLQGVLAAKEAHADRATVEVIAFPQAGLLREEGSFELLEEAMRQGADVVGGIDPCLLDRDPAKHLDLVFGLAERFDAPIDIHLHEPDQLAKFSAELIVERTAPAPSA